MSSGYPRSPKLLKGALVVYESHTPGPPPKVIVFQYNPDQLSRTLEKRETEKKGGGGSKEDVYRVQGPPKETFKLTVQLSAADQLETPDKHQSTVEHGLLPVLSTLEMLLYPTNAQVLKNEALAGKGKVQVKPADLPLTVLVWGKSRVVPVLLTSFSITEESFDPSLNPIQAKVELGMQVLTYMELKSTSQGRDIYLAYQKQKETFAQMHQAGSEESQSISGLLPGQS